MLCLKCVSYVACSTLCSWLLHLFVATVRCCCFCWRCKCCNNLSNIWITVTKPIADAKWPAPRALFSLFFHWPNLAKFNEAIKCLYRKVIHKQTNIKHFKLVILVFAKLVERLLAILKMLWWLGFYGPSKELRNNNDWH